MPKFESNVTKTEVLSKDDLAEMSELAGQIYSHIRVMTRSSSNEYKHQKKQATDKCVELLRKLGMRVI